MNLVGYENFAKAKWVTQIYHSICMLTNENINAFICGIKLRFQAIDRYLYLLL
jgi:hypothetical protein